MTTKAKRARKKANREKGRLERLAQFVEKAMAAADDDVPDERPESEKAAAMTALAAAREMRKKLKAGE